MKADLKWLAENVEWPDGCPRTARVALDPDGEVRFHGVVGSCFDFYPIYPPIGLTKHYAGRHNNGYTIVELTAAKDELAETNNEVKSMELDIRNRDEEQKVERIRWCDGKGSRGTICDMDNRSVVAVDAMGGAIVVEMKNVDDLIAALQKYKEMYS